ncbi:hypothetical protein BD779DRAFT_1680091 [Infundibulicybe gibba]|nr:hypothetical protein BD779DRAFT_1680091 [Infundibulicybe gibba]
MITIQTYDCETTGNHGIMLKPGVDKEAFLRRFDHATLELLRASPDVKSISEDPIVSLGTIQYVLLDYPSFGINPSQTYAQALMEWYYHLHLADDPSN